MVRTRITLSLIAFAVTMAACGDSTAVRPSRSVGISFATGTFAAAPSVIAPARYDITVTGGGNALVITRAQLVLREIELKLSTSASCPSTGSDDDCEEMEIGPVLVDLPLNTGVVTALSAAIPAGSYRATRRSLPRIRRWRTAAFALKGPITAARSSLLRR